MTAPASSSSPLAADWEEVAEELSRSPLGAALFERAQLAVLVRRQQARIVELEQAVRDAPAAGGDG